MSKGALLFDRLTKARVGSTSDVADRARRGLQAYVNAVTQEGQTPSEAAAKLADGTAAQGIGRIGLSSVSTTGFACTQGCAFCCILQGKDGGTMTEAEAIGLYHALAPLADQPDGRTWHKNACAALDPETKTCRAYDARPMICRSYVSTDVDACEKVSNGEVAAGPGTLDPYHSYLAAIGLSRAALKGTKRVATYSLARLAVAAVKGMPLEAALSQARHAPSELDAEIKRSKRDLSRAR